MVVSSFPYAIERPGLPDPEEKIRQPALCLNTEGRGIFFSLDFEPTKEPAQKLGLQKK
jgi:hypothetical protein